MSQNMNPSINEKLIRDVVEEVLSRIEQGYARSSCIKDNRGSKPRNFGVFQDANDACSAAADAFRQLSEKGVAARKRIIDIVKTLCDKNAAEWGRIELEETKIGRLDHKIEKLKSLRSVPGVEFLHPDGFSGDHGITLEEYAPFGVIGAVTPSTHSIPTLACNVISMVAAGNTVVFNAHPNACKCAAMAVRVFNEAILSEVGIENVITMVEQPTLDSFKAICSNEHVRLLCVTGGPGVVKAAMQTGKRAICAGPGNPPVLVDETADIEKAAKCIIQGAAYDNNLLCIGEKEVFVVASVADKLISAFKQNGAVELNQSQLDRLTKAAFKFGDASAGGCAHAVVNKELIGKDAVILARYAGLEVPAGTELLFAETDASNPFVQEEQMMPFIPVVRVRDVDEGIELAKQAEHSFRHTSIIHSRNVANMTAMGRALETTIFIKNGSCLAGLGNGGEGYPSFSIATPTGEGITNPRTFTRVRRCVMVDNLRIF